VVETLVNEKLGIYFEENPGIARKIISKVLDALGPRESGSKARELSRRRGALEETSLPEN